MVHYDVALWLSWPALFPEYVEVVEALTPIDAVYILMHRYCLQRVSRAAISDGQAPIRRYFGVVCPEDEEVMR